MKVPLMTPRFAWSLLGLHLLVFFVGTQMPNAWRNGVENSLSAPFPLSSWAHFAVFFSMSLVLLMRPLACPVRWVLLLAFALALLTEALQFFAVDRHPRLVDVGIDMAGTVLALTVMAMHRRWGTAGPGHPQAEVGQPDGLNLDAAPQEAHPSCSRNQR